MEDFNSIFKIVELVAHIATVIAIIIALWQTKYPYKKRGKIKFGYTEKVKIYHGDIENGKWENINLKVCTFQFVNIGNIDLNIVEYGLMDRKKRVLIPLTTSYFKVQMITEKQEKELPLKIQTQDSINFIYSFDQIIKYIESTQYSNKNDSKKLYFYFKDVTGKVFCKVVNRKKYKVLYQKINNVLKMNKSSNQTIIKIGNSTQMRYKGTITFLNNEKGFAFVKIKKGEDLLVIADNIVGYKTNKYEVGDEVDIILNSPN